MTTKTKSTRGIEGVKLSWARANKLASLVPGSSPAAARQFLTAAGYDSKMLLDGTPDKRNPDIRRLISNFKDSITTPERPTSLGSGFGVVNIQFNATPHLTKAITNADATKLDYETLHKIKTLATEIGPAETAYGLAFILSLQN